MESIMQGDAYSIPVCIRNGDTEILPGAVETVEIAIGSIIKKYPGEIAFSDHWMFPLTQQETFGLTPGLQPVKVRVKFVGGEISGTNCGCVSVNASVSREVL